MKVYRSPRIDHKDPILRTFILFTQTADAVKKYTDALLYKAGLSSIKFTVLRVLARNGGTMTPSAIARWTLRERHNITTLIDRMRRDGLVKTRRSNRDRRSVNITLTKKGRELLEEYTPLSRDIVKQVMSSINEDEVALLEKSLEVLSQNTETGLKHIAERSQPQHS